MPRGAGVQHLTDLPQEKQREVLDVIENAAMRSGRAEHTEWTGFSLVSAMRGMEDERSLYTTGDMRKTERILIVEEIWDNIAAEQESSAVTEAQRDELDRRIASHHASPNEGSSWEEIKRRLMTE
jgi:putative addiction module component (TIGR02574 family)